MDYNRKFMNDNIKLQMLKNITEKKLLKDNIQI